MRRTLSPGFLLGPSGDLQGVNLSSDHCGEHEWGISTIHERFGIRDEPSAFGIERRRVKQLPGGLNWFALGRGESRFEGFSTDNWGHENKDLLKEDQLFAAWNSRSFVVAARGVENISHLREIYEEIKSKNVAIWIGGGGPFGGHGLCLGIIDRIDVENLKTMYEADKETYELSCYHKSTGIEERLRQVGLSWFALVPRFGAGSSQKRIPEDVLWWLYPRNQKQNNYGWMTLQDLEDWAMGRGKIPRTTSVSRG